MEKKTVYIFSDGACSGNPGPGGYGVILRYGDKEKELSGGEAYTTNNRMELMGAITGLEALKYPCRVILQTDSRYVVDGIEKGWAKSWKKRGWVKSDKKPALNVDLWEELLPLMRARNDRLPLVTGCSMGANHAVISFFRRPELFSGLLALSGVYDSDYFFHGWMNPTLYDSSPERFLPNMPPDPSA